MILTLILLPKSATLRFMRQLVLGMDQEATIRMNTGTVKTDVKYMCQTVTTDCARNAKGALSCTEKPVDTTRQTTTDVMLTTNKISGTTSLTMEVVTVWLV